MDHFLYRDGALFAEDVAISEIAAAVGTPFYVYSTATLLRHFKAFDDALDGMDHLVCYAMKANSNQAVLKTLAQAGAGMDVVSAGEYLRAKAAGVPGDKIVFSGVGKTVSEIRLALEGGILLDRVRFRRKADHKLRPSLCHPGNRGQYVGIFRERQRRWPLALFLQLQFPVCPRRRTPVCNSSDRDEHISRQGGLTRRHHLTRCLYLDQIDTARRGERHRTRHQCHPCAGICKRASNRIALLTRRMIREIAHRVQRFTCRPRGQQDMPALQRFRAGQPRKTRLDAVCNHLDLRQAARPELAAGHGAGVGLHHIDAVRTQGGNIARRCGVFPHAHIHGWHHKDRLVRCHKRGGGQIICMSARCLGEQVSGRRTDHDKVRRARQLDMAHLGLVGQIKEIGEHLLARQRRDRQRRDEFRAGFGHNAAARDTAL